jgi:glycosyltransferase involved in cell wall biosynthesis
MLHLAYDITVLGWSVQYPQARTGVFRVVENVLSGVLTNAEVHVTLHSDPSLDVVGMCLEYIKQRSQLNNCPFPGNTELGRRYLEQNAWKASPTGFRQPLRQADFPGLLREAKRRLAQKLGPCLKALAEHRGTARAARAVARADIFHSPFHPVPTRYRRCCKLQRFTTVYDLIPIKFPQFFTQHNKHLISELVNGLSGDDWVFCISESTKSDLCNHNRRVDPSRVFVTPLAAAADIFYRCTDHDRITQVRNEYAIPEGPYLLTVNTLEPRKNMTHVVRCFAEMIQQSKIDDLSLVLVGTKGWKCEDLFEAIDSTPAVRERIVLAGYVADLDLAALYSGALGFVYPSLYEGFGLPPLEAMQCGTPVITSNISSLPEVVGDAGMMVNPDDGDALCQAMGNLYHDATLRASLSEAGQRRCKQFSWQRCVEQTVAAYRQSLAGGTN